MATKPTLKKIEQIANNEEAAVALFNDNFNTLEEVIQDSVSRSGKVPTNMLGNLDMGDKRIINLGKAVGDNDAVRYKDVKDALKESQNAKKYAQNAENAAIRADASAALADTSKREAQKAEAGAKTSEDKAQMIYDELITNEAVATVHENIADVKTVAADIDNVNTTADNMEDIKAVFDIAKRISYGNIGDISATAASIPPDGCRFLNGSAITREEFPDAFKMLDEGTLPFKSVAEWGKSGVTRNYLVLGTLDSAYDEASGLVKSSSGISIFPVTIPKSFSSFRIRSSFEMPTVPTDEGEDGTCSIIDSRFFDIEYGKRATAVVDNKYADYKYSLTSKVDVAYEEDGAVEKIAIVESYWRDGDDPIVRLEANTRYFIDATITNANGVWKLEYHLYASDGVSEIAFRDLEMNGEALKASRLLDFSIEKEDVKLGKSCVWNLPETKIWLDGNQIYQGKKAVFTGNNPYFGFDAGSNVAYLPVAKDIFLEAGDVHAAIVSAGLPNLYGQTVTGAENHGTEYANGIFSISTVNNTYRNTGGDYGRATLITADASRASTIYGNSDTVQPEALKYRHYIVLSHREQMIFTMRESVKAYKDLPKTGNINGDIRMVTDTGIAYIWCRYSRDVWGWSSIGQYLTITAPGKFAWGALGGDLRKQTDLYSRLNLPALAVAGEGIKFEEEREKNFEEFRRTTAVTGEFVYSEDGTHLLGVPQSGSLRMDKINPNENLTASVRMKIDTNSSTTVYPLSLGLNSYTYLYTRSTPYSKYTSFYLYTRSAQVAMAMSSELLEDAVDIFISLEHPTPTTVILNMEVRDLSGNVLAKPSTTPTEKSWTSIAEAEPVFIGNRATGMATSLDIDLTNTWLEQEGVRYYALKIFDEPRTRISVTDLDIIQKNKAKSAYSLILGYSEDDGTKSYRTGYNAERVEIGGSAFGYSSTADEYGSAIGYKADASFGSAQLGEGYSEAFELGFGDYDVLDFTGKLYKDRLPLTAGEGISFTNTSGNRYRLIGDARVEEGLLKFGKEKHNRSCLVSSWGGFHPQNYLEFQIALKDVPAGTTSYSGSYDYLLRSYIRNDGVVEEDGTRYFRAPYMYCSNSKDSGYNRIYYYGFFVGGSVYTEDFNSGDILIKETLIDKVATLQYSKDDGATWIPLTTKTIEETQTAMGAWTMLLGQPENYDYVSNGFFTGSIDLNKSFLYLASNHNTNLLTEGAKRPVNELVVSAAGREPSMPTLTAEAEAEALATNRYEGRDIVDGEVFTSAEGGFKKASYTPISWSSTGLTGGTRYSVIPFKGAIWAIGNGKGQRSLDKGVSWENLAGVSLGNIAATNGDILVCSGEASNYMAWTEDGSTWSQAYTDVAFGIKDTLLYGNGVFVCQGRDNDYNRHFIVSSDGKNWESVADPFSGADVVLKCFDGSRFIAVKYGAIWASENGKDWTQISTKMYYDDMSFFNGVYYAADNNSSRTVDVYSSTDLNTWTKVASPAYPETGSYQVRVDVVGPCLFITVGYLALVSADGVSWSLSNVEKSPWNSSLPSYADGYFFIRYNKDTSLGFNSAGLYRAESLLKSKVELNDTVALLDANGTIPGERMSLQGTTAPTTSTVGSIGQFYVDTATGTGYMCVGVADGVYTWKQITV